MSIIRPANTVILLIILAALLVPGVAAAAIAQFENPLYPIDSPGSAIGTIIIRIINLLLSISAAVALASLVYGGFRLILGASASESEIARAKQIIFWAIIGLVVIGMSIAILRAVRYVLGLAGAP